MKNFFKIKDLSFIVDKPILDKITWNVEKNERWVLMGANGSGKTSLLSTICGYNTPSSGEMTIDDKTYSEYEWQKIRERIAIVSAQINRQIQSTETALETVISGAYAMLNFWGSPSKEVLRRALKNMKDLKISYLQDSLWGKISQGERQKVLIARALMIRPLVMFLDEPCTGLDPVARENFVNFIDELAKKKQSPAMIFATHHVEEIPPSFTHAIVLKDGKVLKSGKIEETLTSKILSQAYNAKCSLTCRNKKFSLKVLA